MIVPEPVDVSIKFQDGTMALMDFPADFTISELQTHLQLAVGMLEGLQEIPDLSISHKGRTLDGCCQLRDISESTPIELVVATPTHRVEEKSIDDDCLQIGPFTRRLMEHANEDAEFVQQNHLILENQRQAQAAVMNAWSRYASCPDAGNFIDALISSQGGYLNKSTEKRS